MVFFLLLIILIPASLYAIFPSFSLGLYGDDWLEIWRFLYTTGAETHGALGYLGYLFSRYGSFDLIMGLLLNFVGYESFYYYLTAYILRLMAALSLYPLTSYLTKNKIAAALSVIFFSVTATGLDATNWVFNMPAYLAIVFLNLFFYFLIKSKFEEKEKYFGISLIYFALAILIAAVRMTGLIPAVIILFIFWFIKNPEWKNFKHLSKQLLSIILVFMLIVLVGNSFAKLQSSGNYLVGSVNNWSEIWGGGVEVILNMLKTGRFDFIFYPFLMIGNMVFPVDLTTGNEFFLIFTGVSLLLISLISLKTNWKEERILTGIFISTIWLIVSFFLGWVRTPDVIFPFTHRYFIVSAVGLSIFVSSIFSISRSFYKVVLVVFIIFLLYLNIHSSRKYLNNLVLNSHGAVYTEKIWSDFPYYSEIGKSKQPLIFYFEGEERGIMHGSITFGFPYHMGVLYRIDDYYRMPLPMDDWNSLLSAVKDGKSLIPYGHPEKPLPISNIYSFKLEGKDKLINTTQQIRQKLNTELAIQIPQ